LLDCSIANRMEERALILACRGCDMLLMASRKCS